MSDTILYRCDRCGTTAQSKPRRPPPALGVYGLPDDWRLVPIADLDKPDELECGECREKGAER
jgi:hypothetical protein